MFNPGIDATNTNTALSGTSGLMQKIKVLYDILLRIFLSSEDDCKYFLKDGITQEDESDKSKIKNRV